jgi:hypothetical protein
MIESEENPANRSPREIWDRLSGSISRSLSNSPTNRPSPEGPRVSVDSGAMMHGRLPQAGLRKICALSGRASSCRAGLGRRPAGVERPARFRPLLSLCRASRGYGARCCCWSRAGRMMAARAFAQLRPRRHEPPRAPAQCHGTLGGSRAIWTSTSAASWRCWEGRSSGSCIGVPLGIPRA